ncbi:MAG: hypothetical protein JEZ00_10790 [Anaerolineaceae bacterium]|nr:hypothetical protein [Anaerolineaceae bacterium]
MNKLNLYFNKFRQSPLPFILFIFIICRLILLLAAWFSGYFLPNPSYQHFVDQGWFLSPHFLIDIWSRWDAEWYLNIVNNGYYVIDDIQSTYSTVAFFPLFPLLVKVISLLVPKALLSQSMFLLIGLGVNNTLLVAALYFLYRFTDEFFHSEIFNKAIIVLFLAYPASFYFSCFYTESLFLFLSIFCLWAAKKGHWFRAAIFCGLLSITRPQGILMVLPIGILLLQSMQWKLKNFPRSAFWLLLIPVPLLLYLTYMQALTGDFFAPITAQAAWGKETSNFKINFIDIFLTPEASVYKIDAVLSFIFIGLSILSLFSLPSPAYGVFALLIILMPVISGTTVSMTRYIAVAFPAFIALVKAVKKEILIYSVAAIFFAIQIFYFVGWVNYYWLA